MRAEVVAVGTELLLGQVVDTNSARVGERLAASGIDCLFQTRVGDNHDRIVQVLRTALSRSEAVICCGGLGPTQDDITREAIAAVMNVSLRRNEGLVEAIRELFSSRGREMPENNCRQADVPEGASVIAQRIGTAPGLVCPVGHKVIYALPGVPYELDEMLERAVLPDLRLRAGSPAVIASRTLRTWGLSESRLAELLEDRLAVLDRGGAASPTLAFLASGIEGLKIRLSVKTDSKEAASKILDAEESEVRSVLGQAVFGIDDETMERTVGTLLASRGWTLALAESLTGGLIASRIVAIPGASDWFEGAVVSYASRVKRRVLGISDGPVVSAEAAIEMAEGARRLLGADVGLATTGVAGPETQEGAAVGTVYGAVALPGRKPEAVQLHLPGDRERVRQLSTISVLNSLRLALLGYG